MTTTANPGPITCRRLLDNLSYQFLPVSDASLTWKRKDSDSDSAVLLIKDAKHGWIVTDPLGTLVLGRPWDVEKEDQGDSPPMGIWVSRKGEKSYVYEMEAQSSD